MLFDAEAGGSTAAEFIDHGVDYPAFAAAGDAGTDPEDVATIPHPRVGFVGGIDALTFGPPLFVEMARRLPDLHFILVGACSLPDDWEPARSAPVRGCGTVHGRVRRPHHALEQQLWIRACNPVKLKEYLAVGRPVVSTLFPSSPDALDGVHEAATAEEFAASIREALASPADVERMRKRVREETWDAKAEAVLTALARRGLRPACGTGERSP